MYPMKLQLRAACCAFDDSIRAQGCVISYFCCAAEDLRYWVGVKPVFFLKIDKKARSLVYPTICAMAETV